MLAAQLVNDFLDYVILDNSVRNILWFAGILLAGLLLKRFISTFVSKAAFRFFTKTSDRVQVLELIKLLRKPVELLIILVFIYFAFQQLHYPESWNLRPIDQIGLRSFVKFSFYIFFIGAVTWVIIGILEFFELLLIHRMERKQLDYNKQLIPFLKDLTKLVVVIFAFLFILGALFKVNVGGLVTGLGLGGLALAFAGKETVENLIASFTIFIDQPFKVGDLVQLGGIIGHVEKIGFRSTRIRTLEKSFLTLPNKQMIDQALDNLSMRALRRARFDVGVTYDTPVKVIKEIVNDITSFLEGHEMVFEDKTVRFTDFGASSLNIMVLYFVKTTEWAEFLKIKEEVNYKIMEIVQERGSSFAFPSTTVYFSKDKEPEINTPTK